VQRRLEIFPGEIDCPHAVVGAGNLRFDGELFSELQRLLMILDRFVEIVEHVVNVAAIGQRRGETELGAALPLGVQ